MKTNKYAYLITATNGAGRPLEFVQYHTNHLQAKEIADRMLDESGLTLVASRGLRAEECAKRNIPYSFED